MTEEEAKTKWCPFVRTGLNAGMAVNRHVADVRGAIDGVYDETRCIASGCMMWRTYPLEGIVTIMIPPDPDAPKPNGYCGLAS